MMQFFAHAGDDTPVNADFQIPPELLIGIGGLLALAFLWLLTTYVFKWRMGARLNLMTALFFVAGVASFSVAPVTATIALAAGMALALFSVIALVGNRRV